MAARASRLGGAWRGGAAACRGLAVVVAVRSECLCGRFAMERYRGAPIRVPTDALSFLTEQLAETQCWHCGRSVLLSPARPSGST